MKFDITQITAAILSVSAAYAVHLEPRQDSTTSVNNSAYPQGTNVGIVNGTCKLFCCCCCT